MNTIIRELKTELANPRPDRRSKDWNKLPIIPAGTRLIDNDSTLRHAEVRYTFETEHTELGKLLLANSHEVEPVTARELAEVHVGYWSPEYILESMVKLGLVGPADFMAVAELDRLADEIHTKESTP